MECIEKCSSPVKLCYWSWDWKHTICKIFIKNDQKDVLISIWECLCLPNYWSDLFAMVINRVCSNWHCVHAKERTIDNSDNPWKELSLVMWSCIFHLDCVYDFESSLGWDLQIENRWENISSPFKEVIFVIFLIWI